MTNNIYTLVRDGCSPSKDNTLGKKLRHNILLFRKVPLDCMNMAIFVASINHDKRYTICYCRERLAYLPDQDCTYPKQEPHNSRGIFLQH